ncbi:MAG TPA: hypothetical protein VIF83_15425, partial [Gemmatimonadaceae bacterium]
LYLFTGLFLADGFQRVVEVFPLPVLGVLLLFEAAALILFIRDEAKDARGFLVVVLVGLIASSVPYGYAVALVIGTALSRLRGTGSGVRARNP